jgi:dipeptidyl-peptidase-4
MTRRRWDYFVKNLAADIPPHEYEMKSYAAVMSAMRTGPYDADDEFDEQ